MIGLEFSEEITNILHLVKWITQVPNAMKKIWTEDQTQVQKIKSLGLKGTQEQKQLQEAHLRKG